MRTCSGRWEAAPRPPKNEIACKACLLANDSMVYDSDFHLLSHENPMLDDLFYPFPLLLLERNRERYFHHRIQHP